ncbi:hypothetical protein GBAR_LOCUS29574 [Geodia barretti]|uniref:Uncharacterized protein n=1 Tax=Geodia barretti TaxID=519541 RepID=A0AA35TUQ8_GEOBA|nr:hypothetical protein GBAR_LOCUS29574 [Geodia barretti]
MDVTYTFNNDNDPCHQKLISWGLQIFPSQTLNNTLYIAACLVGNFEFPPYYELVSPVFYFWSNEPIPDSIKFDMQHSVDAKTRKQATCLSFVSADESNGPPFCFTLLNRGEFNPSSSSGVISTKPQGLLAIVKRKLGRLTLRTDPQIKYKAQVYYTWDTPMEYECTAHFVVTPATKAWDKVLEELFKEAIKGDKKDVSFVKSSLSVAIPDEGLFVKGWSITCTTSKMINYETVGKATDQLIIPECKLTIKWVGEERNEELLPSDLHCNINFTGSHQKKSESYFHLHSRCSQGNELKAGIW